MRWASWTILALGLWLIVAPFALAYTGTTAAAYKDVILGIVIGGLALWLGLNPEAPVMTRVSWVLAASGLWLLIAPFVIGYSGTTAAVWNGVIVGLAVLILSAWQALSHRGGPGEMPHGMAAHH